MLSFEDLDRFARTDEKEDDAITPFEMTLYPIFIKNPTPTKKFIQDSSLTRKRGCFCNDDLYLLPYSNV